MSSIMLARRGWSKASAAVVGPVPAFRAIATAAPASNTTIAVTCPAGIVAGDALIFAACGYSPGSVSGPAGWTAVGPITGTGGALPCVTGVWVKIADGTESGTNVTANFGAASSDQHVAFVAAYKLPATGATTLSFDVTGTTAGAAAKADASTIPTPSITPTATTLVVSIWAIETGGNGANLATDPAVTSRAVVAPLALSAIAIGDEPHAASATTARNATVTAPSTTASWATAAVAIKAA